MAALYYRDEKTTQPLTFDNTESVADFLSQANKDEGEFYTRYAGVKIKYNAYTGEVDPVSADTIATIEISYSKELFFGVIILVADAIRMLAKYDLLLRLLTLNEPDLSTIIRKNHLDPHSNALINKNAFAVDQTLTQVLNECEPDHPFFAKVWFKTRERTRAKQAVYEVLINPDYSLDHIYSRSIVLKIMDEIEKRLV